MMLEKAVEGRLFAYRTGSMSLAMITLLARSCGGSSSRRRLGWSTMGWPTQQARCFRATPPALMLLRSTAAAKCPSIAEPTAPRTTLDAEADDVAVGHSPAEEKEEEKAQEKEELLAAKMVDLDALMDHGLAKAKVLSAVQKAAFNSADNKVKHRSGSSKRRRNSISSLADGGEYDVTPGAGHRVKSSPSGDAITASKRSVPPLRARLAPFCENRLALNRSTTTSATGGSPNWMNNLERQLLFSLVLKELASSSSKGNKKQLQWVKIHALFDQRVNSICSRGAVDDTQLIRPQSKNKLRAAFKNRKKLFRLWSQKPRTKLTREQKELAKRIGEIDNLLADGPNLMNNSERQLLFGLVLKELVNSANVKKGTRKQLQWAKIHASFNARAKCSSNRNTGVDDVRPHSQKQLLIAFNNRKQLTRPWSQKPRTQWSIEQKDLAAQIKKIDKLVAARDAWHYCEQEIEKLVVDRVSAEIMNIAERQLLFSLVLKELASSSAKGNKNQKKQLQWAKIHALFNERVNSTSSRRAVDDTQLIRPQTQKKLHEACRNRNHLTTRKPRTQWTIEQRELAAQIKKIDELLTRRRAMAILPSIMCSLR